MLKCFVSLLSKMLFLVHYPVVFPMFLLDCNICVYECFLGINVFSELFESD